MSSWYDVGLPVMGSWYKLLLKSMKKALQQLKHDHNPMLPFDLRC